MKSVLHLLEDCHFGATRKHKRKMGSILSVAPQICTVTTIHCPKMGNVSRASVIQKQTKSKSGGKQEKGYLLQIEEEQNKQWRQHLSSVSMMGRCFREKGNACRRGNMLEGEDYRTKRVFRSSIFYLTEYCPNPLLFPFARLLFLALGCGHVAEYGPNNKPE